MQTVYRSDEFVLYMFRSIISTSTDMLYKYHTFLLVRGRGLLLVVVVCTLRDAIRYRLF
jgi:hypothetical protein